MNFTKEEIIDYADKLLIGLYPDEAQTILDEFSVIDKNIDQINEIDNLSEVEPLTIGQASRISGVNPADIAQLIIYIKKVNSHE